MLIVLCLLSTCFIQLSIGAPSGREDGSGIKLNEGEVLFEGDIILTKEQAAALKESSRTKRQAVLNSVRWQNDTINYFYDGLNNTQIQYMELAIEYIRSRTCIKFIRNRNADKPLRIISGDGCWSGLGFLNNYRPRELSFGPGCLDVSTGVHELLHTLGVTHEQQRSDRDEYLYVDASNVSSEWRFTLEKENTLNLSPFDYGSVMLYGFDEIGNGSMRPKDMDYKWTMGSDRVSFYDMNTINVHYNCKRKCSTQLKCENGGYTNPANCNVCNCPNGFEGPLCSQLPAKRTMREATTSWVTYSTIFGDNFDSAGKLPYNSYVVVTAPAGRTIEIQIIKLEKVVCNADCYFHGVEIKFKDDPRTTSPIFCCDDELDRTRIFKSKHNPTMILLYTRSGQPKVTYRIRHTNG